MKRAGRLILSLLLVLIITGGAVWRVRQNQARPTRPAVLVVSGDTAGWITPCGCTSNQSGGLLRRGSYIADLRNSADVIYADVGGAPAGTSSYSRVKFEAIIKGEIRMGVCAHNLGGPEAAFGAAALRDIAASLHCPFVSANARDASDQPIAPPMQIVEARGRRLALVGVMSPKFATADVHVTEPRQAVLDALASARGKFDSAIVLAYLPDDELPTLAAELPDADAVIGGPTGQSIVPHPAGPSLIAAATNKGKFLVRLDIPAGAQEKLSGTVVEMGPTLSDADDQVANLHAYLKTLGDRDFSAADTGLASPLPADAPAGYRIAGSESCAACHADETRTWQAAGHAHAWQTLQPRGFHVDPFCLQCHTTGYGLPGGFDSLRSTPTRVGVGCENCHGPSQSHVQDPKAHTPFVAADQCVRCHDHENSPSFSFAAFWPRIQHRNLQAGQ